MTSPKWIDFFLPTPITAKQDLTAVLTLPRNVTHKTVNLNFWIKTVELICMVKTSQFPPPRRWLETNPLFSFANTSLSHPPPASNNPLEFPSSCYRSCCLILESLNKADQIFKFTHSILIFNTHLPYVERYMLVYLCAVSINWRCCSWCSFYSSGCGQVGVCGTPQDSKRQTTKLWMVKVVSILRDSGVYRLV